MNICGKGVYSSRQLVGVRARSPQKKIDQPLSALITDARQARKLFDGFVNCSWHLRLYPANVF
jgi:hypothetical protein